MLGQFMCEHKVGASITLAIASLIATAGICFLFAYLIDKFTENLRKRRMAKAPKENRVVVNSSIFTNIFRNIIVCGICALLIGCLCSLIYFGIKIFYDMFILMVC